MREIVNLMEKWGLMSTPKVPLVITPKSYIAVDATSVNCDMFGFMKDMNPRRIVVMCDDITVAPKAGKMAIASSSKDSVVLYILNMRVTGEHFILAMDCGVDDIVKLIETRAGRDELKKHIMWAEDSGDAYRKKENPRAVANPNYDISTHCENGQFPSYVQQITPSSINNTKISTHK